MGNKKEIITNGARETRGLGEILAKEITAANKKLWTADNKKKALIIGLEGELGSGKTAFVQGLAMGLGIKEKITSPTFVILKKYGIPNDIAARKPLMAAIGKISKKTRLPRLPISSLAMTHFFHIDCYRIRADDLLELGFEEIANNSQNIIIIEWAEKVKKILKNALWIKFEYVGENKRKITIIY
ncbi:MAG: tRNA (adenosine(37)-N6)-threonylcarbamoyltransferase complex ATPase subunit type 1 TsaE [Patescibacteria group bacterium]|nr:tRNA (adenosine(37)-N6)-threonylcarbamoyltransferase complex ATPase subunit type 1 TsaE [Patescibacteria group bacterium]